LSDDPLTVFELLSYPKDLLSLTLRLMLSNVGSLTLIFYPLHTKYDFHDRQNDLIKNFSKTLMKCIYEKHIKYNVCSATKKPILQNELRAIIKEQVIVYLEKTWKAIIQYRVSDIIFKFNIKSFQKEFEKEWYSQYIINQLARLQMDYLQNPSDKLHYQQIKLSMVLFAFDYYIRKGHLSADFKTAQDQIGRFITKQGWNQLISQCDKNIGNKSFFNIQELWKLALENQGALQKIEEKNHAAESSAKLPVHSNRIYSIELGRTTGNPEILDYASDLADQKQLTLENLQEWPGFVDAGDMTVGHVLRNTWLHYKDQYISDVTAYSSIRNDLTELTVINLAEIDKAYNLSLILHGMSKTYARLDVVDNYKELLFNALKNCEESLNSKSLASIFLALASLKVEMNPDDAVFQFLRDAIDFYSSEMSHRQVAKILFSWGKIGFSKKYLPTQLISALHREVSRFNPKDISQTLAGWSKLFLPKEQLPVDLISAIEEKAYDFEAKEISFLLPDWATLGFSKEELPLDLWLKLLSTTEHLDSDMAIHLIWGLSLLNAQDPAIYPICFQHLEEMPELKPRELHKLFITQHLIDYELPSVITSQLEKYKPRYRHKELSLLESEVRKTLEEIKVEYQSNRYIPAAKYYLDIAYEQRGKKYAIVIDGPENYFPKEDKESKPMLNLATQIRNQLLEKAGWKIISIPFYEWSELKTDKEQQQYLREKIKRPSLTGNHAVLFNQQVAKTPDASRSESSPLLRNG
jgi:hypothetical protein